MRLCAWRGILAAPSLLLVVGCGDGFGTNLVGAPPDGYEARAPGEVDPVADYPEGPYGGGEGEVLQNMVFAGYYTELPFEGGVHQGDYQDRITLDDVRKLEGFTHLLLTVGAEWCKPCREEAVTLRELYPDWAERGGFVLGVINQDKDYNSADQTVVEAWSRRFQTPYTLVHDPEGFVANTLAPSTVPLNIVIELETMKILRSRVGEDPDTFRVFDSKLAP